MFFHKRLLKLFTLRAKEDISDWKLKSINRVLKKEKEKLTKRLDDNLFKQDLRPLNPASLTDKKVISLFDSSGSRALNIKKNELCDDVFVLSVFFFQVFEDVVKKGFVYNGKKYIFLTASAGQIRVKKGLCISEADYDRIKDRLTCGLSIEQINEKGGIIPNKYLAYSALNWSATEPWLDLILINLSWLMILKQTYLVQWILLIAKITQSPEKIWMFLFHILMVLVLCSKSQQG